MKTDKAQQTIEERLQPWIDEAEYVIAVVITIMSWSGGWINLLAFESWEPTLFGRYSVTFFTIFIIYTLGFIPLFWLLLSLSALSRLKKVIVFFQNNLVAFLLVLAGIATIIASMVYIDEWETVPLIQLNALIIMSLFILLVLYTNADKDVPSKGWRKVGTGFLGFVLFVEILLQGLAFVGQLPFDTYSGLTVPYGRIVQNEQGVTYAQTNRFGWYYPDFDLETSDYRVAIIGDQYVAGVQVPLDEHFGQLLEGQLVNRADNPSAEVMVRGQLGFGTEMYLRPTVYDESVTEVLSADEIIIVLHLANDVLPTPLPSTYRPTRQLWRGVTPYIAVADFDTWHMNVHSTLAGYEPVNLLNTIYSNSMLLTAIGIYGFDVPSPVEPLNTETATDDMLFGDATYMFQVESDNDDAERALTKLTQELIVFNEYMQGRGIEVNLVTIPYFPAQFYSENSGSNWETTIAGYDLLLPDYTIAEVAAANDISYLSLGRWMQEDGMTVDAIQGLFFNDGIGYFNTAGHQYVADAIYACFYSAEETSHGSCNE